MRVDGTLLLLERRLQDHLAKIEEIYDALGDELVDEDTPEARLVAQAYRLQCLYNVCEGLFRYVSKAFEGEVGEGEDPHRELLDRMRLDLTPIRPALIAAACYEKLDELLRFRHLFQSTYRTPLDSAECALVQRKALELREPFRENVEHFLDLLRNLEE